MNHLRMRQQNKYARLAAKVRDCETNYAKGKVTPSATCAAAISMLQVASVWYGWLVDRVQAIIM